MTDVRQPIFDRSTNTTASVVKPKTPSGRSLYQTNVEGEREINHIEEARRLWHGAQTNMEYRPKGLKTETESFVGPSAALPQLETHGSDKGPHKEYIIGLSQEMQQFVEDIKNAVKRFIQKVNQRLTEKGFFSKLTPF